MGESIDVFIDRNDARWTTQRHYVESLVDELEAGNRVSVVDDINNADIVHLNYLNPLGRTVWGKESLFQHLWKLIHSVTGHDVPVVVTEHGVEEFSDIDVSTFVSSTPTVEEAVDATKRGISRLFARHIDAIIAISSIDRRILTAAGFDPDSVHRIPHGVGHSYLDATESADDGFVLHVSKCAPHKNPGAIIETAKRLDTTIKIVGQDWSKQYGGELMGIENVDIVGYVNESTLLDLYTRAAAYYHPSTYEPFGLSILEAMACGTPVVASTNSAAPDICKKSIALVDPADIDQHVTELSRLLENEPLRTDRGQKARESAKSFTWSRTADLTADVYETLVTELA